MMSAAVASETGRGAESACVALIRKAALPAMLTGLLVLAVLFLAHRYRTGNGFCLNSDDLYPVELCQDLLGRGYERSNWHIPYAPQLFPEIALLLPCVFLFRDLLLTYLAYNCLYHGISVAVLTALCRTTGLRWREAFLLGCSGQLFLVAALLDPTSAGWIPSVFVPASHGGAVLAGLTLWLIVVRTLHRPLGWKGAALYVGLGGVAIFSDRLVLAQFIGPICLTVLGLAIFRAVPWRKALGVFVLTGAAHVCALGIQYAFARSSVVLLPLGLIVDFSGIREALKAFRKDLPVYVRGQYLVITTFFVLLAVASVVALSQALLARRARLGAGAGPDVAGGDGRRQRLAAAALALAAVLACACNLAAIVLSGVGRYPGTERYLLAALFVPFLFLGVCLRFLPGRRLALLGRGFPLAVLGFAAFELGPRAQDAPPFRLRELRQPYSELARTLDRLAREGKIGRGIATYWNARTFQYQTREDVQVKAVHPHGEPWLHLQNPNSFLAPRRSCLEVPRYNFILFDPKQPHQAMRREDICRFFGAPREKVAVGQVEIWIYDGLVANPLTLFLRSMLAPRLRAWLPCQAPAEPRELARPVRNFAPAEGPDRVTLKPDGEVKVVFAEPVHGSLLDLGAAFDGHYEVTFHDGAETVGRVYVPRANFPVVSTPYLPGPGIQSRLVTIPPAARARGWTTATVRGAGGPGTFTLGHFLVYGDTRRHVSARQMRAGGRWSFPCEFMASGRPGPGGMAADSLASEGKARFAPGDFSGVLVHGPYLFLEPGRYRVEFHLRADVGTATGPVGSVSISSECGKYLHAQRQLVAADLAGPPGYRKFSVEFEADVDLSDCEFRVISLGKVPLYADRVELICER
jgi:hypothetical protein